MKMKIVFFLVSVFLSQIVHSQITKSYWLIGGSGSLRSSNYDEPGGFTSKQTIVQLSGDVGYFIIDKFAVGVKPGFNRSTTNQPKRAQNIYKLGPFARYYFLPAEKVLNIFSEVSYQFGKSRTNTGVTQSSKDLSAAAGVVAFFNTSVALEFTVGYSSFSYNTSGKVKNVIAGIGFHFHLEKDK